MARLSTQSDILRDHGLRSTPARRAVWEQLSEAGRPTSVGDLLAAVRHVCDRVTVYRVLADLEHAGLVQRVASAGGRTWFQRARGRSEPDRPVAFHCSHCGSITWHRLKAPPTPVDGSPRSRWAQAFEGARVALEGVCPSCLTGPQE